MLLIGGSETASGCWCRTWRRLPVVASGPRVGGGAASKSPKTGCPQTEVTRVLLTVCFWCFWVNSLPAHKMSNLYSKPSMACQLFLWVRSIPHILGMKFWHRNTLGGLMNRIRMLGTFERQLGALGSVTWAVECICHFIFLLTKLCHSTDNYFLKRNPEAQRWKCNLPVFIHTYATHTPTCVRMHVTLLTDLWPLTCISNEPDPVR